MARPLMNLSSAELGRMVERNATNVAELELVLSELRHRSTEAARKVEARAQMALEAARSTRGATKTVPRPPVAILADPFSEPTPNSAAATKMKVRSMDDSRRWTENAVAALRAKLIDLSKRNTLIAFKHGARAGAHLRIVDECHDLLFEHIGKKPMGFEPLPDEDVTPADETTPSFQITMEHARLTDPVFLASTEKLGEAESDADALQAAERELRQRVRAQLGLPPIGFGKALDVRALALAHGFDPSFELRPSDDAELGAHHADDRIRVLLTRKQFEKTAKAIWEKYRSHERETGLHTLYLAFGFVEWFEDDSSSVSYHAPLLVHAVELERRLLRGRYEYQLSTRDEPLQVNVALIEKLRQHMGLELPALREDETPESYFIRAEAVLVKGKRLSLRRFATLAILPFHRMILWKDLSVESWPEAAFYDHRLLPALLGAKEVAGDGGGPVDINIDEAPWSDIAPPLIQPADASQHAALIDAVEGKSISIEGPPGTGKSQTITNLIAGALAAGKNVLFVAEKQAALSVVASRLRKSGFGSLLLEMHGETAQRTTVYDNLRERLQANVRSDGKALDAARWDLRAQRDLIRRYIALIRQPLGALERTAHWLAWREIALRSRIHPDALSQVRRNWQPGDLSVLERSTLSAYRSLLRDFAEALASANGGEEEGPNHWNAATALPPFDQSRQLGLAKDGALATSNLAEKCDAFAGAVGAALPSDSEQLEDAMDQLAELQPFDSVREEVAMATLLYREHAQTLLAQQNRWRQLNSRLEPDVASPGRAAEADVEALRRALIKIPRVPQTVAKLRAELEELDGVAHQWTDSAQDRETLVRQLGLDDEITVSQLSVLTATLRNLGAVGGAAAALWSAELLPPITEVVLREESGSASQLDASRRRVQGLFGDDFTETSPSELEALADTLESTSWYGRAFGGEFKMARRRAARLLSTYTDREVAADALRQAARMTRAIAQFAKESPAAALFPSALWRGVDSDWSAISQARSELHAAMQRLAGVRAEAVLDTWLTLSPVVRDRITGIVQRVPDYFALLIGAGFGDVATTGLAEALAARIHPLRQADECLDRVNVLTGAEIVRDGQDLASRLNALSQAEVSFQQLRLREGFEWVGEVSQPLDEMARALDTTGTLLAQSGPLNVTQALKSSQSPVAALETALGQTNSLRDAFDRWDAAEAALHDDSGIDAHALAPTWAERAELLRELAADEDGARRAANVLRYRKDVDLAGLGAFAELAQNGAVPPEILPDLYELASIRHILDHYLGGNGEQLGRMGSLRLESARKRFTEIDKQLHELEAKAIVANCLETKTLRGIGHGPKAGWTEMALVESELALKRPRLPLRDLTHRSARTLQAIKPVWMMSPTSAAQFIPPNGVRFDLLVIDEASQMRPEYALSSILRAEQIVIVGDANQLPPTDFFATSEVTDGDDGEEGEGSTLSEGVESILDLANQKLRYKRRLRWHYRSQHESLIQFSNRQFYERNLVVFPSPTTDDDLLGVKSNYVGGRYDASINQDEAEAIVQEAYRLMKAYPERSIGIVTMNSKQTELIRAEFDRLAVEAADVRAYIDEYAGTIDEFFIKNLENVQGDERDIMLISTVYGPDAAGIVAQRFGPMNREVGWRRLNVLVTRAKLSTRIFTSLRPDDIKVTETSSRGVRALREYLLYASGGAMSDHASGGEPDSDFEIFVADELRNHGFDVVHQVGVERFRIDLGVRHPAFPLGYIAGIECDGATYHSDFTVRDRDRIRQSILESMGWRIYRIWSTDWFQDPQREMRRLLSQLEQWRREALDSYTPATTERQASDTSAQELALGSVERALEAMSEIEPTLEPVAETEPVLSERPEVPIGRAMRSLDELDWFETSRGTHYTVWSAGNYLGEIEVLSRVTAVSQIYGSRGSRPSLPEYEGKVEATGERFIRNDIHATVREIGRKGLVAAGL